MNDRIDDAYADLNELRTRLPDLSEARVPGTPRRATYRDLTSRERRALDNQARADRAAAHENIVRGIVPSGYSAAPIRMEVLDAEAAIEHGVATLENELCERYGLTPGWAPPLETIGRIIGLLGRVAGDQEMTAHVANEARRMNRIAGRALGEAEPVTRIDARCPHCSAISLRAFPDREVVMCINLACRCADVECGCRRERARFYHEWTFNQWPGLAAGVGAA